MSTPLAENRPELDAAFMAAGLAPPPVPARFADMLEERTPEVFASVPLTHAPYEIERCVEDFIDGCAPALILGFGGRGLMSPALHYFLVDERVGVFIQQRWGSPVNEPARDARHVATLMKLACELATLAQRPEYAARFADGRRLLAVESSFMAPRVAWVGGGRETEWLPCPVRGAPVVAMQALVTGG